MENCSNVLPLERQQHTYASKIVLKIQLSFLKKKNHTYITVLYDEHKKANGGSLPAYQIMILYLTKRLTFKVVLRSTIFVMQPDICDTLEKVLTSNLGVKSKIMAKCSTSSVRIFLPNIKSQQSHSREY